MLWWERDNAAAFAKLQALMRASTRDAGNLMRAFAGWAAPLCQPGVKVWGNSPSFDLALMENMCKRVKAPFPIPSEPKATTAR